MDKYLKIRELKKHSSAIQITNNISAFERRLWDVLLAISYKKLLLEEQHFTTFHDLQQYLNFDSQNIHYIECSLDNLVNVRVRWNFLRKDKENGWDFENEMAKLSGKGGASLLAGWKNVNGKLYYSFAPELKMLLHNPKMYALIPLGLQNNFNDKHSLALYQLFLDYHNPKLKTSSTPEIPLETFRELMGLKDGEHAEFKHLNQRVIIRSIQEIEQLTDFRITVEYRKVTRKVISIKFHIQKLLQQQLFENIPQKIPALLPPVQKQKTFRELPVGASYKLKGGSDTWFIKTGVTTAEYRDTGKPLAMTNVDCVVVQLT